MVAIRFFGVGMQECSTWYVKLIFIDLTYIADRMLDEKFYLRKDTD